MLSIVPSKTIKKIAESEASKLLSPSTCNSSGYKMFVGRKEKMIKYSIVSGKMRDIINGCKRKYELEKMCIHELKIYILEVKCQ